MQALIGKNFNEEYASWIVTYLSSLTGAGETLRRGDALKALGIDLDSTGKGVNKLKLDDNEDGFV